MSGGRNVTGFCLIQARLLMYIKGNIHKNIIDFTSYIVYYILLSLLYTTVL